jgi:hypothetical protein
MPVAQQYSEQGLNTLPERATFEDGGNGVEAGVIEMLDMMQTRPVQGLRASEGMV